MLRFRIALLFCWIGVAISSAYERTSTGLSTTVGNENIVISFITPQTVRIVKYPTGSVPKDKISHSVIAQSMNIVPEIKDRNKDIIISSGTLSVSLNKIDGTVSFINKGKQLLTEHNHGAFKPFSDAGEDTYSVKQSFKLDKGEAIYGLGNLENGELSQRGQTRKLLPGNIEDGIPVIMSVKGYGLFWDNYSPTTFCDNAEDTYFESEVGDIIDYYFMAGDDIRGVIGEMRNLTGKVPMFPLWTYGFWQSRERYKSQEEIVNVVKKYRELGIPLDGIIQDWQYWGNNYLWNAMEFMNPEFPDPQRMVDEIHGLNAHTIISIWSSFGPQTKPYKELAEKGLLFDIATWPQSGIAEQWPPRLDYPSGVKVYDAYSSEARDIYWKHLSRLHSFNIDGWWMDSTEPDHFDVKDSDYNMPTSLGSFRKVRNAYPLLTVGGVYDHQRKVADDKRVFILTRSGYAGQQRYGCNVWTGDVTSSWHNLRNQIPALLNFTMTGNPNCNSDLGGFFCNAYNNSGPNSAVKNPLFQELFVRWMQFGVFTPMMRSHGADIKREIYYFGEKGDNVYDAIADAIKLRYSLLPYIYSTSWNVTSHNGSFMLPLSALFPNDKNTWNCKTQYMFGDNMLIAPIVHANYTPELLTKTDENTGWDRTDRLDIDSNTECFNDFMTPFYTSVYLPKGALWWDFDTNEKYNGGITVKKEANLKTIPVFIRAGSIIPFGPDVQYATEKPWDNLAIRIYPGADGKFCLYEDEFDNYNYENGQFSTIDFIWNDKSKTLTIDDRKGSFNEMLNFRKFDITIMTSDGPKKLATADYEGKRITVR